MMGPELQVYAKGNKIVFRTRFWNGIDRPDYKHIEDMTPTQARDFIAAIGDCLTEASLAERATKARRKIEVKAKIKTLQAELVSLEKELAA